MIKDRSRKHFGKRRKCWYPAFSLSPKMLSKCLFFTVNKYRKLVCFGFIFLCIVFSYIYVFRSLIVLQSFLFSNLPWSIWPEAGRSCVMPLWQAENWLKPNSFYHGQDFTDWPGSIRFADASYNHTHSPPPPPPPPHTHTHTHTLNIEWLLRMKINYILLKLLSYYTI